MSLYFGFNTPEERKKRRQAQLYGISEIVTKFFWDDAPSKFHFEEREGQQEMAFEILDAIKNNQHIAVEAGVGIGKSFAYSVPLLLYCQKTSVPIVIATSTIALQEQLLKDIGRLKDLLGIQTNVILAKGQAHYLCSKRAEAYLLTPGAEMVDVIEECMKSGHHDRRSFTCAVPSAIWDKINISRFNKRSCMACAHRDYCQYYQLRDDLRYSDGITLCNQDLLTAHLFRLSRGQEGFLNTEDGIIVVDEAHNLEEKVRNATTERFGQAGILNTISAAEREVRSEEREYVQYQVTGASRAIRALFQNLNQQMKQQINDAKQDMKYAERFFFHDTGNAVDLIHKATTALESLASSVQIFGSRNAWRESSNSASDDLSSIAQSFSALCGALDDNLIWLERHGNNADLVFCPKNTNQIIHKLYFSGTVKTILTSATLANTAEGSLNVFSVK